MEELRQIDQKTRKLMMIMMQEALHLRDDTDRLYVSRKEAGRGLISGKHNVDSSIQGGACGVMVIVEGNEHGDTSSNPGRD